MLRDGWEIDAHTLTHPDLTTVDAARLRREVAGSRRWLRQTFAVPVNFFAYPSGRYNPAVEAAVRAAGYGRRDHPARPGHRAPRDPLRAAARPRHAAMTPGQLVARSAPRAAGGRRHAPSRPCGGAAAAPPARGRASPRSWGGCWPCRPRTCARRAWRCAPARRGLAAADVDAALTDERSVVVAWLGAARCTSSAATTTRGCWGSPRPRAWPPAAGGWARRASRRTTPSAR